MIINEFSELEIECIENCYNLEFITYLTQSTILKANIPKLMPLIPTDSPYEHKVPINNSILVNTKETKPNTSSFVTETNYLSLKPWLLPLSGRDIPRLSKFTCIFKNKNIKDCCYGRM